LPRGGKRSGAGRPRKQTTVGSGTLHYHRPRKHNPDEDDRGVPVSLDTFKTQFLSELAKLQKRVRSGKAQITDQTGQWAGTGINYATTHALYEDWPLVHSAVDWAIDTVLENGYRTESIDAKAKELIDKFCQAVHMDDEILPRWILSIHLDGDIFQELRWSQVETDTAGTFTAPTQLFPLPADVMRYKYKDETGKEVLWTQFKGGRPIAGLEEGFKKELQHWSWRPVGTNPYGTPVICSILDDVETLINFQTDYREIIKWYVKPFWHVLVGTPDKPTSDTLLKAVRDNWEDRDANTDLITAANIDIKEHGIGGNVVDVEPYLTYHDNKQVDGLQSPFTHILRSANQASASEIRDNSLSRVVYIQRWLKRKMEELFTLVLTANNVKAEVKATFQPLRAITLKDRVDRYIKLLNPVQVQLDDKTRLEVVNRLRMELLDVPRDDTLQLNVQPMPGQQGLFGKIKKMVTRSQTDEAMANAKLGALRALEQRLGARQEIKDAATD